MSDGDPRVQVWRMIKAQFLYYLSDPQMAENLRRWTKRGLVKLRVTVPAGSADA